jgi:hypothetical protein
MAPHTNSCLLFNWRWAVTSQNEIKTVMSILLKAHLPTIFNFVSRITPRLEKENLVPGDSKHFSLAYEDLFLY